MKKLSFCQIEKLAKSYKKVRFPEIEKMHDPKPRKKNRPGGQYKRHCIRKLKSNITVKVIKRCLPRPSKREKVQIRISKMVLTKPVQAGIA